MEKEQDGVWRTIRGRRIFIAKGESLGQAMTKSGKFKREDIRTAKTQLRRADRAEKTLQQPDNTKLRHKMTNKGLRHERDVFENRQAEKNRIHENGKTYWPGDTRVERYSGKYSETDRRELDHEELQKKLADYKAKKQSNNKFSQKEQLKKEIAHEVVKAEQNGNYAHAEAGKRELERLNKQSNNKIENNNDEFDMRKYTIELQHDKGTKKIDTIASSKESAIKSVLKSENAPDSAVKSVKDNGSILNKQSNNKTQGEQYEDYKRAKLGLQSNNKVDPYDDPESNESQRLQSIQSRYDEYLQDTEGRGASYGEIAYVDSLRGKDLDDFEKELDDYEAKKYGKQETIKKYVEKKKSNNSLTSGLSKQEEKELRENYSNSARINLGKVDYYGNGRKVNQGYLELDLKNGVFSARGGIKNGRGTDSIIGGQALDDMAPYFKDNKDFNTIRDMWKKYHLNDMHAGTEKQESALEKKFGNRNASDYDKHVEYLKSVGLYEDNGYKYGTGWLKRDIPTNDLKKIKDLIEKYKK